MKPTLLILYKHYGSLCVFMVFLVSYLRPYFNLHIKSIDKINIDKICYYECVIPTDTASQEFYNTLKYSPFQIKYQDTYLILDNKANCYKFVQDIQDIDNIPTLLDINKNSIEKFILKYPSHKFILKSRDGVSSFSQTILSSKELFEINSSKYKNYILQPYIDNYHIYSLDLLAKDGIVISELYTKISKNNGVSFFDFFTSIKCEILKSSGAIYKKIQLFSNRLVKKIHYSGIMEIEFLVTKDRVYFLEVNPRMCGHVSQLDKNYNSIYFNNIIIPYIRYFGYRLPRHKITSSKISGTNPTITILYFIKNYKYTLFILFIITLISLKYFYSDLTILFKNICHAVELNTQFLSRN